jgi:ElaB/YqjD/DUF883 family membrane-anchored ribosome-binding protein
MSASADSGERPVTRSSTAHPVGTPPDTVEDAADAPFRELFEQVEDLIKRVADIDRPEVQRIRAKARVALMVAQSAMRDGTAHVRRRALHAANQADDYLHEYPWQALGLGVLLGFGVGVLVARDRGE